MQQNSVECSFSNSDSWSILSPIEQSIKRKIEAAGTPLKYWDIQINYGIKTGFNDAFIINTEKRNEILEICKTEDERARTAELIRPILRGRDIKRYGYEWAGLYLIYIPWHFPFQFDSTITGASEKAEKAFKEQYPAVYSHMLQYKEPLSKRNKSETGIRYEWYALQRWGAKYWEDFDKPKIIWKIIGNRLGFVLEKKKMILNNACYILTCSDGELEYLEAMLNSNAILWYSFVTNMNKTGVGDMQVGAQNINILPVPKYPQEKGTICKYVNILHYKIDNNLINKIESLISKIYGFSDEEQLFLAQFAKNIFSED